MSRKRGSWYNKSRAGLGRSQASLLGLLSAWRLPITSRQRLINRYHGTVCRRLWRQCEIHYCPSSPVANGGSAPGGAWTDPLSVYYFSNHTSEWNLGWEMTRSSRMCHADGQLVGGVWQGGGPRDQPCCQPLSWREALHLWPGSRLQVQSQQTWWQIEGWRAGWPDGWSLPPLVLMGPLPGPSAILVQA